MWIRWLILAALMGSARGAELTELMRQLGYYPVLLYFDKAIPNQLQVHAKVDGQPMNLVLDTGAPQTAISERLARRVKPLKAGQQLVADYFVPPEALATNAAGNVTTGVSPTRPSEAIVVLERLELAGAVFEHVPATVSITKKVRSLMPFDVILGADFLLRNHAVLACAEHTLFLRAEPPRLAAQKTFDESLRQSGLTEVRMGYTKDGNRWHVPTAIQKREFSMLLDTGAVASVLDQEFTKALGLISRETPVGIGNIQGTMTTIGRVEVQRFRLGSFGIARAFFGTLDLQSLGLGEDKVGKPSGEIYQGKPVEGLLGMDLLARNVGVIDCVQHKLWLKKVLDQ